MIVGVFISAEDADETTAVIDTNGQFVRHPVLFEANLEIGILKGRIALTGAVPHGLATFDVIAHKTGDFE